jgi:hypothetical protein
MSDSHSISHQFKMAVRFQEHASNSITVLLLDEVGLAEHSPDMPLKVLHGMLVDPPIAIVGLSNWVLDPAKMNRAVLVQRPEPSETDISKTGAAILGVQPEECEENANKPLWTVLENISKAFFTVYTAQRGRDFIGMRDYYCLIKFLKPYLVGGKGEIDLKASKVTKELMIYAICRNFSGRHDLLQSVLHEMLQGFSNEAKAPQDLAFRKPSLMKLISDNLHSKSSRHLMLLTKNFSALWLLLHCNLVPRSSTQFIIGSEFPEDKSEFHIVQNLNLVKLAMATGKTVVLMNCDNMYEALYDVLNQRYLSKKVRFASVNPLLSFEFYTFSNKRI